MIPRKPKKIENLEITNHSDHCRHHHPAKPRIKCAVKSCKRLNDHKEFCDMHYQRFMNHGNPEKVLRIRHKGEICSVKGCKLFAKTRQFCGMHNARYVRHGDPLKLTTFKKYTLKCKYPKCNRAYAGNGFCSTHNNPFYLKKFSSIYTNLVT